MTCNNDKIITASLHITLCFSDGGTDTSKQVKDKQELACKQTNLKVVDRS